MVDEKIVDMYWTRSEHAITETAKKYGHYCHSIAYSILRNHEDSEECVNDTYLGAWNSMPTQRPNKLAAFLGKITRNLALNKYEYYSAEKRGNCQITVALEELAECLSASNSTEEVVDIMILRDVLDGFLGTLDDEARNIFIGRYWFLYSIREISEKFRLSESKVKVSLYRSRVALRLSLEKEGVSI